MSIRSIPSILILVSTILAATTGVGAVAANSSGIRSDTAIPRSSEQKSPSKRGKTLEKGRGIYLSTCRTCHELGALGAPRLGNEEDWKSRLPKGRKTLLKHALKGFGAMPAKGGDPDLTSKEVAQALDYMLSECK